MKIAGLDWSMTSPGLVVGDISAKEFTDLQFYGFQQKKKQVTKAPVKLELYPLYSTPEERFDALSQWTLDILVAQGVTRVFLEGYAYGTSKGVVFEIGENTGVLKHKLMKAGISFEVFAPSEIKKHATGLGNSNKVAMELAFRNEVGVDLSEWIGSQRTETNIPSPANDIIDAYWIWSLGKSRMV